MQGSLLEFQGSIKDVSRLFQQTWEFYHLVPKSFSSLCSVSHQIPEFFYANFGLWDNNPTPINNKLLVYGFNKSIWWWLMQAVPKIHIVFNSLILLGPEACLKHFHAWFQGSWCMVLIQDTQVEGGLVLTASLPVGWNDFLNMCYLTLTILIRVLYWVNTIKHNISWIIQD